MNAKTPPIPSENRSPKGTGEADRDLASTEEQAKGQENFDKQGQQGNSHVNTTHQGSQQDR